MRTEIPPTRDYAKPASRRLRVGFQRDRPSRFSTLRIGELTTLTAERSRRSLRVGDAATSRAAGRSSPATPMLEANAEYDQP
jgi:hypothetical protein